ncbi:MAG TPA: WXG100 family type VII secretion target [Acidimicrobiales bacterium]|nr:WXG100 family type VII secretion target [Acidimicrobiales bacterium]
MSTMVGASLEQMQGLEQQFTADGQAVGDLQRRISAAVGNTTWTGPAADRFRSEWNTTFVPALSRLQEALQENASVVRNRRSAIQAATA